MSNYTGIVNIRASGKKADVVAFDLALSQAYSNTPAARKLIGTLYHDAETDQTYYNKSAYASASAETFLLSNNKQPLNIRRFPSLSELTLEITLTAYRTFTTDDYTHNASPLVIDGFEEYSKFINGDQVERVIQPSTHYMPSYTSHTFTKDSLNDLLGIHLTEDEFCNQLLVKRGGISDT